MVEFTKLLSGEGVGNLPLYNHMLVNMTKGSVHT